ncbi:hypothetical protein [Novosphingobium sp.]|uniref:hypothetical protein n=1 Tax=Novosphingobium sp. TaxID=1874826 RepID=UPI00286D7038|nr:hypothetical protein [Novosphingobium sp.]
MQFFPKAFLLISVVAVQACAVSTPVRLSVPRQSALPDAVSLDLGPQPGPALTAFANRFTRQLNEGGVTVRSDAPYRLTLTLSAQPSLAGVTSDGGSDPKAIDWQSRPRRKGLFENCAADRLRAVAVGSIGLNANPPLVAEAELDSCKDRTAELDRLAVALAGAITRR